MSILNEILIFEHESAHVYEHDFEHNLSIKKNFSAPKIYNANGNLKRRWYVYFSYRNPETGKLERMQNIYGKSNLFKTKEDRLNALSSYRRSLLRLLKEGYNPLEDNLERLVHNHAINDIVAPKQQQFTLKPVTPTPIVPAQVIPEVPAMVEAPKVEAPKTTDKKIKEEKAEGKMKLREAFDFALEMKFKIVKQRTHNDYARRVKTFIKWLAKKHPKIKTADQISRKIAMGFLNDELRKKTPRSRNNSRLDLSSLMQVLEDNEIIPVNVFRKTPILKAIPERHKRYDEETLNKIFEFVEKEDPILLLFIKFISYNFLRPIEVCRLRVKDLNLKNKTLQFKAKNSPLKTKIIPDLILEALPDLSSLDGDNYLITKHGIGAIWKVEENNRRNHFSNRYKNIVKTHFGFNKDYGLYSFRHTYITKLYRKIAEDSSPFEAKSKLMQITGHSSMAALEKYLRDIDADLPSDYSDLLRP